MRIEVELKFRNFRSSEGFAGAQNHRWHMQAAIRLFSRAGGGVIAAEDIHFALIAPIRAHRSISEFELSRWVRHTMVEWRLLQLVHG